MYTVDIASIFNREVSEMKFEKIEKVCPGKFITRYDITYTTEDQKKKVYEMISRNHDLHTQGELQNPRVDGVVIIMHDEQNEKILLNREFRMAVGACIYNFPAGLVDEGEMPEVSAKRELKEETGLDLLQIRDTLYDSYSAIGFSNETNVVVIGTAGGNFAPSTSTLEEIEAGWYTRQEVRELLKTERFAARTQAYCYLWAKQEEK